MKNGMCRLVVVALGLSVFASASARGEGPDPERRVSLDFVGVQAEDLFRALADELHLPLTFDQSLSGQVSIRLDNVRITTALDAACDSIGCTYAVVEEERPRLAVIASKEAAARGRGVVTESLVTERVQQPISLSLKDAAVGDVMRSFGHILRCEVELLVDPAQPLTLELQNVPAMDALDRIGDLLRIQTSIHWGPLADDCRLRVAPQNP